MEKRPLNFLSYFLVFLLIGFCHSIAQANYSYQYEWHNDISETVLEKSIVNEPFVYNASVTFTKSTTEIFDTHYAPACKGTYHLSLKNVGSTAISDLEIFDHIPSVLEVLDVEFDSSLFNITQNGNEYTFTLIQGQEITSDQSIDIFIDFKIDKNVAPGMVISNTALATFSDDLSPNSDFDLLSNGNESPDVYASLSATHQFTVAAPNHVQLLSKCIEGPNSIGIGDVQTFRINIFNNGSKGFTGVVIDDLLDNNLEFVSYEVGYGNFLVTPNFLNCNNNLSFVNDPPSEDFSIEFDSTNISWNVSIPGDCDFLRVNGISIIVEAKQLPAPIGRNVAHLDIGDDTLSVSVYYGLFLQGGIGISKLGRSSDTSNWSSEIYAGIGDEISFLIEATNTGNVDIISGYTITDELPDCLDLEDIESVSIGNVDIDYEFTYPEITINQSLKPGETLEILLRTKLSGLIDDCVNIACVEALTPLSNHPLTACSGEVLSIQKAIDPFQGRISVFPNPSNEYVNIEFEIENEAEMLIEVFNMKGQLVQVLSDFNSYSPGSHMLKWNPDVSGQYFVKFYDGKAQKVEMFAIVK